VPNGIALCSLRADIWAFGVMVYELITGKGLFPGETAIEVLGAILNKEPDLSAAPPRLHRLLRWCLEKDGKERLQPIADARRLPVLAGRMSRTPHRIAKLRTFCWMTAPQMR